MFAKTTQSILRSATFNRDGVAVNDAQTRKQAKALARKAGIGEDVALMALCGGQDSKQPLVERLPLSRFGELEKLSTYLEGKHQKLPPELQNRLNQVRDSITGLADTYLHTVKMNVMSAVASKEFAFGQADAAPAPKPPRLVGLSAAEKSRLVKRHSLSLTRLKTDKLRAKNELRDTMVGGVQDIRDAMATASKLGADVDHARQCAKMLLKHSTSLPRIY